MPSSDLSGGLSSSSFLFCSFASDRFTFLTSQASVNCSLFSTSMNFFAIFRPSSVAERPGGCLIALVGLRLIALPTDAPLVIPSTFLGKLGARTPLPRTDFTELLAVFSYRSSVSRPSPWCVVTFIPLPTFWASTLSAKVHLAAFKLLSSKGCWCCSSTR